MKTLLTLLLILIALPAHSAQYDELETDKYTYALRCGNEWISSVRYQWEKNGIFVPTTLGSVKEVVKWMTDKVTAEKPNFYIAYKAKTDAFGNHYSDTVDTESLIGYIQKTISTYYGIEAVEWREKQGISKQNLGLPDKIDDCIVEPVWAALDLDAVYGIKQQKVIGREDIFLKLDPIDQVLLMLSSNFRKLKNNNYKFALIFADKSKTTVLRDALLSILKNSPNEFYKLKSGIEVKGCVETSIGEDGDFKCNFARFFKGSQEPFRRHRMGANESDAEKINELKSQYRGRDQDMFFTLDGRLVSMPAGRIIGSSFEVSLVRRPFYKEASNTAGWMQISGYTNYRRKILFDKDGDPRLEPNAKDDEAIEVANKREEARRVEAAKEWAEYQRKNSKCSKEKNCSH